MPNAQKAAPPPDEKGATPTAPRDQRQNKRTRYRPAPAAIRRAISAGEEVDLGALWAWWEHQCHPRFRGLPIDTAALVSVIPVSRMGRTTGTRVSRGG